MGVVAFGVTIGLLRLSGDTPGDGLQINIAGGVFAQFYLSKASAGLINADYVVSLPITYRRGKTSARFRLYHQSSHLGDEFLLRKKPVRINLAFQSFELLVSHELGPLRPYGGAEYRIDLRPDDLKPVVLRGGLEYRHSTPLFRLGNLGSARPVAAIDTKSWQQRDWRVGVSGRLGLEFGTTAGGAGERTVSLLLEFYDGPNPFGQFYKQDVTSFGIGAHLTL